MQPRSTLVGDDGFLDPMKAAVDKQRGYAYFFDWPDKAQKEAGLLDDLREAAEQLGIVLSACEPVPPGQDPPDAKATVDGRKIAIEFTEFVDSAMIQKAKATGAAAWRWWTEAEAVAHLNRIVAAKDHAGFGSSSDYWVVIHCDELALDRTVFQKYVSSAGSLVVRGISRCFLLLSYDPGIGRKPLLEVAVSRVA
jgi:sugar phosphate isomerase/epimerase